MNKIIDTQCECCNTDTILKIVAGNDFTLRLALTYHEDDVVKEYDLSDIQDLKVIAYSPEGVEREVDSMVDIATNRIIAVIDSYEYINYVPYGIDITWYDEPNHKRASAPNLFAFVNSSGEANDSQDVIVSGPYDYNLEIKSDIAYVSVGEIPEIDLSDYVTNSELNTTLQLYETKEQLSDTLENYATKEYVDDELEPYINEDELGIVLENYATVSSLEDYATNSTLENYATKQYVDDELANIDLTDYYTKTEVDTTLSSYGTSLWGGVSTQSDGSNRKNYVIRLQNSKGVHLRPWIEIPAFQKSTTQNGWEIVPNVEIGLLKKETATTIYDTEDRVATIESDYITSTSLNTTLQDYVTNSALSTSLNPITNDITSLDTRVTTLENNPSGVSQEDWDNSNEAIAKELTDNRLGHLSINDKFKDYYTKTESDDRYATASWANSMFVTKSDDVNRQEAIAAAFAYLQTAIDESGGGGSEIDLSSYVTIDEMNNYSEVVSTALTYHKLDIINTNDKFDDYYTMTQSDNRYITSNAVAQNYVSNNQLDNLSYVVAASLNDLNDRTVSYTSQLTNDSGFVSSSYITSIVQISQSDYDALTTKDTNTLYIII